MEMEQSQTRAHLPGGVHPDNTSDASATPPPPVDSLPPPEHATPPPPVDSLTPRTRDPPAPSGQPPPPEHATPPAPSGQPPPPPRTRDAPHPIPRRTGHQMTPPTHPQPPSRALRSCPCALSGHGPLRGVRSWSVAPNSSAGLPLVHLRGPGLPRLRVPVLLPPSLS